MKKLLLFVSTVALALSANGQVFSEHFDNSTVGWLGPVTGYTYTESGSEWTITGDGSTGTYASISYTVNNGTAAGAVDISADPTFYIYVQSDATVDMRIDIKDGSGYVATAGNMTFNVVGGSGYALYTHDFTGATDGGYGGTACGTGPCAVDFTDITEIHIYADDAAGGFTGNIDVDYMSIGGDLTPDVSTSIASELINSSITVSPNPASETVNVAFEGSANATVALADVTGSVVATASGNDVSIDVSGLAPGLYILSVDGVVSRKVIVE